MPVSSTTSACSHATLKVGERCPGCGKLYSFLAAKGLLGAPTAAGAPQAAASASSAEPSGVMRAWLDHPVLALFRHRGRLAFFRQLHSLLKAGEGLPVIFTELGRSASSAKEKEAVAGLRSRVEAGSSLVDAARLDPLHFDPITLELLAAAEVSGSVVGMLQKVIERMEAAQALRWKTILSALYPMYLVGALLFVGPLMDLPAVAAKTSTGQDLAAAYLFGLVRNLLMLGGAIAVVLAIPLVVPALGLEVPWDRVRRRVPLLGGVIRDLQACRFCEAFGAAASSGLDADRTLALSLRATGSATALRHLGEARGAIGRGGSFADAVGTLGLLDGPALGQFSTGERIGEIDQVMQTLSREYSESAARKLRMLTVVGIVAVIGIGLVMIVVKILGVFMGTMSTYDSLLKDG